MNEQPEALRLAEWLDHYGEKASHADAAAELRRLYALNAELLRALNAMLTEMGMDEDEWNKQTFNQARAAIAKAQGGIHE